MPAHTIPTDRDGLLIWLCEHPDHVGEYLEAHGGRFAAYAQRRTSQIFGRPQEALGEEIADEAMAILFERSRDGELLTIRAPVDHWLFGVIKTLVTAAFRKRATATARFVDVSDPEIASELAALDAVTSDPFPADTVPLKNLARAVADCMQRLPARQQEVATMRLADLDHVARHGDIAANLGISTGSVAVHWCQARQSLENCLRQKGVSV